MMEEEVEKESEDGKEEGEEEEERERIRSKTCTHQEHNAICIFSDSSLLLYFFCIADNFF
jgi:hypothetical protein